MKKFSVILLVAVLAMTCVFAEAVPAGSFTFSGSATAKYAIGLDKGNFGYTTPDETGLSLKLTSALVAKSKENTADKPYAVIGASITFGSNESALVAPNAHKGHFVSSVKLTTFQIVKENVWTLDFLGSSTVGDFAASFELDATGAPKYDMDNSLAGDVAFTWTPDADHEYVFVGAANRDADEKGYYTLGAQSPVFTLVKGEERVALDIQGAAGFDYDQEEGWTLDGSIALGSDTKAANIAAAADVMLYDIQKDNKIKFDFDARLAAKFGPITKIDGKDAYFAHLNVYASKTAADKKNLDAKAAFYTNVFNNNTPVTVEVSCLNILADAAADRNLSASADITIAKNYTISAYANNILNKGTYGVKGTIVIKNAEDAAKKFTITNTAEVSYALATKTIGYKIGSTYAGTWLDKATLSVDNNYTINGLKHLIVKASAETTHLVNGATIALAYGNDDLLNNSIGDLTASCTIKF